MNSIRTIIIDDERLARQDLKRLVADWDEIQIIGEAENAFEAKEMIELNQPDLIFLDIQMPRKNGFELLEELDNTPIVIFVTAYDEYAIQAFDVNALDYIVKPIRTERFNRCIQKAIFQIQKNQKEQKQTKQQIFVKDANKCYFIKLSEISYIKSIGNYAQLHFNGKAVMVKRSLNYLEETLPDYFFRCNRSEIINHHFIDQIHPLLKGALQIELITKHVVDLSDRKSVIFKEKLKL